MKIAEFKGIDVYDDNRINIIYLCDGHLIRVITELNVYPGYPRQTVLIDGETIFQSQMRTDPNICLLALGYQVRIPEFLRTMFANTESFIHMQRSSRLPFQVYPLSRED